MLTVSLKKTEVMLQTADRQNHRTAPVIQAGNVELKAVDKFCYLGSVLSNDTNIQGGPKKTGPLYIFPNI